MHSQKLHAGPQIDILGTMKKLCFRRKPHAILCAISECVLEASSMQVQSPASVLHLGCYNLLRLLYVSRNNPQSELAVKAPLPAPGHLPDD